MRAIWNGHITFGLISIPVALHSAVEASERVSFRLLHRKDHAPIVYKKFCSKEDVEVGIDEIVKGYELDDDSYAAVEKEDIEKAEQEAAAGTEDMEVLQFVELGAVNPLSFDHPYYISPRKGGEKAYGVLRDALLETRRVGIVRFLLRRKPTLGALLPGPEAIALESLRPYEELRNPAKVGAPPTTKKSAEVKMAKMLVDQMSGEGWDPTEHQDEYRKSLRKLLASKKRFTLGETREGKERPAENVVDLMDALKKSLGQQGRARPTRASGRRKAGAA
ncbi:MAG: Ku protein [Syntrophomonadaceae bacterium]